MSYTNTDPSIEMADQIAMAMEVKTPDEKADLLKLFQTVALNYDDVIQNKSNRDQLDHLSLSVALASALPEAIDSAMPFIGQLRQTGTTAIVVHPVQQSVPKYRTNAPITFALIYFEDSAMEMCNFFSQGIHRQYLDKYTAI
jgi:hypothetical protein